MMTSRLGDNDYYGEISIDSQEPITKKFLECLTDTKANQVLDVAKQPITAKEICRKLSFSNATIYKKISILSEIGLLHTARIIDGKLPRDIEKLRYVRTFFVVSVRCGNMEECQCHFEYPIVQIASKREFLGIILRTIRQYQQP